MGQDTAGALRKNAQEFVLGRGQLDRAPGHRDPAPVVVDGEIAQHDRDRVGPAPQRRTDPRHQFGRREGLDDVVVGAGIERTRDGLVAAVA